MPRPLLTPAARWLLLALLCGAVPPAALQTALAAAAGSLFETAPFVLAAELLSGRRFARFVPSLGCGCGAWEVPGALSLPATAVAWLTFGPAVAAGRYGAALGLAALAARGPTRRPTAGRAPTVAGPDAFAELAAIAPAAFAASLAAQALAATPWLTRGTHAPSVGFAAGLLVGTLAPCATAAVAIAASLAHPLPAAAGGILCSAGLVPPLRLRGESGAPTRAGFASALLAVALGALALRGPSGFVNPRLTGCIAVASLAAAAGARRRTTRSPSAALLPGAMLAALVAGSPAPPYRADATTLTNGFPGEHLDFTGVTATARGVTTLERFAITCCRIDATAVAVRLTARLPLPNGRWVAASGPLVRTADGSFELEPTTWRAVRAPPDPFIYR